MVASKTQWRTEMKSDAVCFSLAYEHSAMMIWQARLEECMICISLSSSSNRTESRVN